MLESIMPEKPGEQQSNLLVYLLWAFGIFAVGLLLYPNLLGRFAERDFAALWIAGKLVSAGHVAQAFDVESLQLAGKQMIGTTDIELAYPYPPHALFIAVPLSFLPLPVAFWTWQVVSAALFFVAARPYLPEGFPKILVLLTPPALINMLFGQVGLFFGALWLFAFSGSTLAAALLTFKPHLGFLVTVEVVRTKRLLATVGLGALLLLASVVVFGPDSWRAWFNAGAAHQVSYLISKPFGVWHYEMTTPYLGYGLAGWVLFGALGIYLLTRRFDVFTSATASFLIAPYGFHYDMTVVSLGFGLLLFHRWRAMPAWQTFVCAAAFLTPFLVSLDTRIASPLLLLGLFVQTKNPITNQKDEATSANEPEVAVTA